MNQFLERKQLKLRFAEKSTTFCELLRIYKLYVIFGMGVFFLSEDLLNSFHERSEFVGMLLLIQSDT